MQQEAQQRLAALSMRQTSPSAAQGELNQGDFGSFEYAAHQPSSC